MTPVNLSPFTLRSTIFRKLKNMLSFTDYLSSDISENASTYGTTISSICKRSSMTKEKIAVVERIKMHISHYLFFLLSFSLDTHARHKWRAIRLAESSSKVIWLGHHRNHQSFAIAQHHSNREKLSLFKVLEIPEYSRSRSCSNLMIQGQNRMSIREAHPYAPNMNLNSSLIWI